jgi:ABC-type amino acid transport system permease subunit
MWCSTDRLKWFLGRYHTKVKNEILTTVHISMVVFWVAMPYGLVHGYQRFGGTYCLHLQGSSEVC